MNDENAWIDEIIMKHKNQLKVLKDSNNEITNLNPNISKSLNNFQKFYQSDFTNTMDLHSEFKNNEIKLQKKLSEKKEKIHQLKLEITNLKNENETLKNNLKNIKLNNQNENLDNLKNIIETLQYKNQG